MATIGGWRPTRTRAPLPRRPSRPERRPWWRAHPRALAGGFATAIGLVVAFLTVLPKLEVQPLDRLVSQDPSPNLLEIKNAGLLPISDVRPGMGICKIDFYFTDAGLTGACPDSGPSKSVNQYVAWRRSRLDPGQLITISTQDLFRIEAPIRDADISIDVTYRMWPLSMPGHNAVRLGTRREADGQLYWFEK